MQFSFGSDPEFCLVDKTGAFRSAIDVIPGTKKDPVHMGGGHYALWDNVMAECCPHYGRTKAEVLTNFRDCFQKLADLVHPFLLHPQASHTYPAAECEHPGAKEFGCDPELNAYEMQVVNPPLCSPDSTFRSAGGHIHLGYMSGPEYPLIDTMGRWWAARYLDWFVGLPSVLMDTDPTSQDRRRLYGGAGNLRPKNYGLEYRTLSVFWLRSPATVALVWDLCEFTLAHMQQTPNHQEAWEEFQDGVRKAIDTGDRQAALDLFQGIAAKAKMPKSLVTAVRKASQAAIPDFYRAWDLKKKKN
jgi:hypothetical protein